MGGWEGEWVAALKLEKKEENKSSLGTKKSKPAGLGYSGFFPFTLELSRWHKDPFALHFVIRRRKNDYP